MCNQWLKDSGYRWYKNNSIQDFQADSWTVSHISWHCSGAVLQIGGPKSVHHRNCTNLDFSGICLVKVSSILNSKPLFSDCCVTVRKDRMRSPRCIYLQDHLTCNTLPLKTQAQLLSSPLLAEKSFEGTLHRITPEKDDIEVHLGHRYRYW